MMYARITRQWPHAKEALWACLSSSLAASVLLLHRLLELFAARLACFEYSGAKALLLVCTLPCLPVCLLQRTPFFGARWRVA